MGTVRRGFAIVTVGALLVGLADAQVPAQEWVPVSLSKEDTVGAAALIALFRNAERFARWVDGKPLGESVIVGMVALPTQQRDRRAPARVGVPLTVVVAELDGSRTPIRSLLLDAHTPIGSIGARTCAMPRAAGAAKAPAPSASTTPTTRELDSMLMGIDSLPGKAATCGTLAHGTRACRASDAGVSLVRAASRHAKALASNIASAKHLALDDRSAKSVTFEESADGSRLRNVTITGFLRECAERLVAPDATSAWVVTITGEPDSSALDVRIVKREADAHADPATLDFASDR